MYTYIYICGMDRYAHYDYSAGCTIDSCTCVYCTLVGVFRSIRRARDAPESVVRGFQVRPEML